MEITIFKQYTLNTIASNINMRIINFIYSLSQSEYMFFMLNKFCIDSI